MILTLALVKQHVRADEFSDDDTYLQQLTETAEEMVITMTNRTLNDLKTMSSDGVSFPKQLQQAVLLIVGHFYNQREAVAGITMTAVPYGVDALVKPFRKLV